MRKKTMMVAMLVGALSLGACVDNNESASVEAVRGAKAEQLKSVATLNNATAEATLILAKADVAIKEAEAEAKRIANELQGIELEIEKAGLTSRLEAAKVDAEAELLAAKARLETAKAELIAAMDRVTIAEKQRVQELLSKADVVLDRIDDNRQGLINAKFAKAGLEAGLEGVKASQDKTIAMQTKIIAQSEALIAEYGKHSQTSKEEALKAANEAEATAEGLDKIKTAADNVLISTIAKENAAKKLVAESVYLANATMRKAESIVFPKVEYTYADGSYAFLPEVSYTKYTANKDAMKAAVDKADRDLAIAKLVLKDANKALTDLKATEGYKALEKAVADAKKAYNEATTTVDKAQARQELDAAEYVLKSAAQNEEDAVKDATDNVAELAATAKKVADQLAAVETEQAAYTELLKAQDDAIKANRDAEIASDKATHDYTVQNTLTIVLKMVAASTSDIADLILGEKETIANAKVVIAETKDVANKEELIAAKAREIAKLEQKLKIDEAAYADYMAQIKALIEAGK